MSDEEYSDFEEKEPLRASVSNGRSAIVTTPKGPGPLRVGPQGEHSSARVLTRAPSPVQVGEEIKPSRPLSAARGRAKHNITDRCIGGNRNGESRSPSPIVLDARRHMQGHTSDLPRPWQAVSLPAQSLGSACSGEALRSSRRTDASSMTSVGPGLNGLTSIESGLGGWQKKDPPEALSRGGCRKASLSPARPMAGVSPLDDPERLAIAVSRGSANRALAEVRPQVASPLACLPPSKWGTNDSSHFERSIIVETAPVVPRLSDSHTVRDRGREELQSGTRGRSSSPSRVVGQHLSSSAPFDIPRVQQHLLTSVDVGRSSLSLGVAPSLVPLVLGRSQSPVALENLQSLHAPQATGLGMRGISNVRERHNSFLMGEAMLNDTHSALDGSLNLKGARGGRSLSPAPIENLTPHSHTSVGLGLHNLLGCRGGRSGRSASPLPLSDPTRSYSTTDTASRSDLGRDAHLNNSLGLGELSRVASLRSNGLAQSMVDSPSTGSKGKKSKKEKKDKKSRKVRTLEDEDRLDYDDSTRSLVDLGSSLSLDKPVASIEDVSLSQAGFSKDTERHPFRTDLEVVSDGYSAARKVLDMKVGRGGRSQSPAPLENFRTHSQTSVGPGLRGLLGCREGRSGRSPSPLSRGDPTTSYSINDSGRGQPKPMGCQLASRSCAPPQSELERDIHSSTSVGPGLSGLSRETGVRCHDLAQSEGASAFSEKRSIRGKDGKQQRKVNKSKNVRSLDDEDLAGPRGGRSGRSRSPLSLNDETSLDSMIDWGCGPGRPSGPQEASSSCAASQSDLHRSVHSNASVGPRLSGLSLAVVKHNNDLARNTSESTFLGPSSIKEKKSKKEKKDKKSSMAHTIDDEYCLDYDQDAIGSGTGLGSTASFSRQCDSIEDDVSSSWRGSLKEHKSKDLEMEKLSRDLLRIQADDASASDSASMSSSWAALSSPHAQSAGVNRNELPMSTHAEFVSEPSSVKKTTSWKEDGGNKPSGAFPIDNDNSHDNEVASCVGGTGSLAPLDGPLTASANAGLSAEALDQASDPLKLASASKDNDVDCDDLSAPKTFAELTLSSQPLDPNDGTRRRRPGPLSGTITQEEREERGKANKEEQFQKHKKDRSTNDNHNETSLSMEHGEHHQFDVDVTSFALESTSRPVDPAGTAALAHCMMPRKAHTSHATLMTEPISEAFDFPSPQPIAPDTPDSAAALQAVPDANIVEASLFKDIRATPPEERGVGGPAGTLEPRKLRRLFLGFEPPTLALEWVPSRGEREVVTRILVSAGDLDNEQARNALACRILCEYFSEEKARLRQLLRLLGLLAAQTLPRYRLKTGTMVLAKARLKKASGWALQLASGGLVEESNVERL